MARSVSFRKTLGKDSLIYPTYALLHCEQGIISYDISKRRFSSFLNADYSLKARRALRKYRYATNLNVSG